MARALDFTFDLDRDPLRVLETTRLVVESSIHVRLVPDAIEQTADRLANAPDPAADWNHALHPTPDDPAQLANLVLVLDALNFCFWSLHGSGKPRWSVRYSGQTYDGYFALAVALRRAQEAGYAVADGEYLAAIPEDDVAAILAGDPGSEEIPLLRARMEHLREVGHALLRWGGSFLNAIELAEGSAPRLIRTVLHEMPSFQDTAPWNGHTIRFYKRAQILVADLYGAFGGQGPGKFHDLETLTAFADYKVPQVLRRHGILRYTPELAGMIDQQRLLPPESDEEIEIRAATIWGVELLRQELARRGRELPSFMIDWALWQAGQDLPADTQPYHRTLTVFY